MIAEKYSIKELMAVSCAREIKNGERVFIGIGLPMMSALIAQNTHAKDSVFVYEGGGVGGLSRRVPWSIADNPTAENALMIHEMWRLFSDTQAGFIDRGVIGGAQIDKYGNLNTTVIFGKSGNYKNPKIRLPGSGGANDIGSSTGETTIIMQLEKGKFVEKIDYITTPGHLTGGVARQRTKLVGKGPSSLICQKGIFRFHPQTKEMYLDVLFPGSTVDEIKALIDWDIKIAENLKEAEPPLKIHIDIMKKYDPRGIMLGAKSNEEEDFDEFFETMRQAYKEVVLDF
ncbi:MAG: hypothetical protein LBP78_02145 [Acidaminococcales bacterium]|jgi:glutaconate CoA-transferase subunit B|nr:hypothetical protein [Acidaminococcales bacterium]